MRKILVMLVSILFIGCFRSSDEYIVVDRQIQDPMDILKPFQDYIYSQ